MSQTELGWQKQMVFQTSKCPTVCSEDWIVCIKGGIVYFKFIKLAQAETILTNLNECVPMAEDLCDENATLCMCS